MNERRPENVFGNTTTSTFLLEKLQDPANNDAWNHFTSRYRPMIIAYAQRAFGLTSADAEDVAQTSLMAFCRAYQGGQYNRDRGRLRKWLFGIVTNRLRDFAKKRGRNRERHVAAPSSGADFFDRLPDNDKLEDQWEMEWRRAVYRQCIAEVKAQFDPQTVTAFDLLVQHELPADEVAKQVGISRNAVYLAKHHIIKRIRELVLVMDEVW